MDWVKLVILALDLVGKFARWVEENKITSEAQRQLIEQARKQTDANVAIAEQARADVRASVAADPGLLRRADKYTRPD